MNSRTLARVRSGIVLTALAAGLGAAPQLARFTPAAAQTAAPQFIVCGAVTAVTAATASAAGSLTIGGTTVALAPGSTMGGTAVTTGQNVCLYGTLNSSGQVMFLTSTANPNTATSLLLCGPVQAYTPATTTGSGSLTVGSATISVASGTSLPTVSVGAYVCLAPVVNSTGQITAVSAVTAPTVCGNVTAYTAPTGTAAGTLTLGGVTYTIASGVTVSGPAITVGNAVCFTPSFDINGVLIGATVTSSTASPSTTTTGTILVCGPLVTVTPATATGTGSIVIGNATPPITIAAGVTLAGVPTSTSTVCLFGTLNSSGQLASATLTNSPYTVANVPLLLCGTVGTFTAATSAAAGSLTIGASTIPIATGATVTGLTTGQFACINATLNASGQLTAATVSTGATQFCGTVTAYTASTATTAGTLTIAGATFGIAAGTVFSPDILALNGNFCIQGTFNASGQLTGGTVTFAVPLAATPVYGTVDRKHQQLAQTLATQAV